METMFELMMTTITSPREAFRKIRENPKISSALIFLLILGVLSAVSFSFSFSNVFSDILRTEPSVGDEFYGFYTDFLKVFLNSPFTFVLLIIGIYLSTFLRSALYEFIVQFVLKKSNGIPLFIAFSFAQIPTLISLILVLVLSLLGNFQLSLIFSIIFVIWRIYLYALAISEIYETNIGTAFGIFFIPVVAGFIISIILSIFLVFPLMQMITKIAPEMPVFPFFSP